MGKIATEKNDFFLQPGAEVMATQKILEQSCRNSEKSGRARTEVMVMEKIVEQFELCRNSRTQDQCGSYFCSGLDLIQGCCDSSICSGHEKYVIQQVGSGIILF